MKPYIYRTIAKNIKHHVESSLKSKNRIDANIDVSFKRTDFQWPIFIEKIEKLYVY